MPFIILRQKHGLAHTKLVLNTVISRGGVAKIKCPEVFAKKGPISPDLLSMNSTYKHIVDKIFWGPYFWVFFRETTPLLMIEIEMFF